jgi:hypothetical protein
MTRSPRDTALSWSARVMGGAGPRCRDQTVPLHLEMVIGFGCSRNSKNSPLASQGMQRKA